MYYLESITLLIFILLHLVGLYNDNKVLAVGGIGALLFFIVIFTFCEVVW